VGTYAPWLLISPRHTAFATGYKKMDIPTRHPPEHDTLLARARGGDTAAFWQLAESYRTHLKRVAAKQLGSRLSGKVDASDVVQQGFLAAHRRLAQFHGRDLGQWLGWMTTIVRNQVRKALRYWHRERRDLRREQRLADGSAAGCAPPGGSTSPSQRAVRREQAARLLAALERLPAEYQEVLRLRNFGDLPYADIAARMNRSEEAVRQLWARAVRRLRGAWKEEP
jgi:RNA polymerase sigma-70 factor (ECF subfamily)